MIKIQEWEIRQEERERIKEDFIRLMNDTIRKRLTKKKYQSKHTISISGFQRFGEEFFKRVDNPRYDIEQH